MLETFNISLQISMDVKVKVIVDSCGDIPDDILKRYDIGMVPLNIELGELLRDRVDISPQEYYAKIYEYNLPNTSSPNLAQWKEQFDFSLNNGYDKVIVVALSSKLSNTYQQACVAAKKFYPDDVKIINSLNASAGEGLLAIRLSELIQEGKEIDECITIIEDLRPKVIQIGYMDSLKMLVKSGRISKASEFFATLGRMKPMIITEEGENKPLGKVISLKNARKKAVEEIINRTDKNQSYSLFITHAEGIKEAEEVRAAIEGSIKISKSFIGYMGPVVGSRVGLNAQLIAVIPD